MNDHSAAREKALQQIIQCQIKATKHIEAVNRKLDQMSQMMEETEITKVSGLEVHSLSNSFLKLCTKMATINPTTSERAFEMLRSGEWAWGRPDWKSS